MTFFDFHDPLSLCFIITILCLSSLCNNVCQTSPASTTKYFEITTPIQARLWEIFVPPPDLPRDGNFSKKSFKLCGFLRVSWNFSFKFWGFLRFWRFHPPKIWKVKKQRRACSYNMSWVITEDENETGLTQLRLSRIYLQSVKRPPWLWKTPLFMVGRLRISPLIFTRFRICRKK